MKTTNRMAIAARAAILAGFPLCASPLCAAGIDYVWVGASGGSWTDSSNWERTDGEASTSYPKPGDVAIFMPGDGVSLAVSGSANIARMAVSNGNVTVTCASGGNHQVMRETKSEGGHHPHIHVADGASLTLTGGTLYCRADALGDVLTKTGGGKLVVPSTIGRGSNLPYSNLIIKGGVVEASDRIYASDILIESGASLRSLQAGFITTFDSSTNITVEAGGRLRMTGAGSKNQSAKQQSLVPIVGAGELQIAGWVTMEPSQLANFTGTLTGSGNLEIQGAYVYGNVAKTGGGLTLGGDTEILAGNSTFSGDSMLSFASNNVTLVIKGGFLHRNSISNQYTSSILPDYGGINVVGDGAPTATIRVEGGRMHFSGNGASGMTPARLEQKGGVIEFISTSYLPNSGMTVENPAVVLFDGGETLFAPINGNRDIYTPFSTTVYEALSLQIGANGATFDMSGALGSSTVGFYQPFRTAAGVAVDGGLTRKGTGSMVFHQPVSINGPVRLLDGVNFVASPSLLAANPSFFGSGSFTLENAVLDYDSDITSASTLNLGAGSTFTYGGIAMVNFDSDKKRPARVVNAGSLVRKGKGSVLQVMDYSYGLFDGGASRITFAGGLENNAAGIVKHPVLIHIEYGGPEYVAFATYDETLGLRGYTNYLDNALSSDRIVRIGHNNNNFTVPSAGGSCAALFLRNKSCIISADRTLSVGDGVNPALVVIGKGAASGGSNGTGTLDFGTSEGVVYVTSAAGKDMPWNITGSQGVTFATRSAAEAFNATVSGVNTYSGGTWITGGDFTPMNSSAFSSGKVTITGGKRIGGSVNFKTQMTMANDFAITGYGKATQSRGAISFEEAAELTGDVEIDGFARIGVQSNVLASVSGVVSGGLLEVCGTTGTLALASCNTYTGGTVVAGGVKLRLANGESAGTGPVTLDKGVLVFRGRTIMEPIVFTNSVAGIGRIVVEGKASVTFTDPSMAYVGAATVYPGTSISFPALAESDTVVVDAPPVNGIMIIVR